MSDSRKIEWLLFALVLLVPSLAHADLVQTTAGPVATAASSTFLTNILRHFVTTLRSHGNAATAGSGVLVVALMGLAVSQSAAKGMLRAGIREIAWPLAISYICAILVMNMSYIAPWFTNSLSATAAGSSDVSLSNPSQLITKSMELTSHLFKKLAPPAGDGGVVDTVKNAVGGAVTALEQWPVFLAGILLFFGFLWTALTGMAVVVYVHAKVIIGTLLTPWLVFSGSRPLGMAGVNLIISAAVELAVQTAIVSVGFEVLQTFTLAPEADFQAILETAGGALAVAFICSGAAAAVALSARAIKFF
jgi:hypothetical protein